MAIDSRDSQESERLERIEKILQQLLKRVYRLEEQYELPPLRAEPERPAPRPAPPPPAPTVQAQHTPPQVPTPPFEKPPGAWEPPPPPPAGRIEKPQEKWEAWPPTQPQRAPPTSKPAPPPKTPAPAGPSEIELLVGGKWALWVGSLLVFFTVAFFLAYQWHNITPPWRIAIGFLTGLAFLAVGEWQRDRASAWFSQGLTGAGLGVYYATIWSAFQGYHLIEFDMAFLLMGLTTALGVLLALRYNAVSLQVMATLGGFLTPVLLRSSGGGESQALPLLSYIAVLNAGILVSSLYKRWRGIHLLAFVATLLVVYGWADENYREVLLVPVFSFITLFFLMFMAAAVVNSLSRNEPTHHRDLALLFADAFVYAWAGYTLLRRTMGDYPVTFPAALAVFHGSVALAAWQIAPQNSILRRSLGGIALFFITISIPIHLKQQWIAVGWSIEAAILSALGRQYTSDFFHAASKIVYAVAAASVLWALVTGPVRGHILFLNAKGLPLLVFVAASAQMGMQGRKQEKGEEWQFAALCLYAATLGGAWLIAQETFHAFRWNDYPTALTAQAGALFAAAALTSLYALGIFSFGLRISDESLQGAALVVMSIAAALPLWASGTQSTPDWSPFFNFRMLAYAVIVAVLAMMTRLMRQTAGRLSDRGFDLSVILPLAASIIAVFAMSIETYFAFSASEIPTADTWELAAWFAIAQVWLVFAVLLLLMGVYRRAEALRITGLILAGLALGLLILESFQASDLAWEPLFNWRFYGFVLAVAALAMILRVVSVSGEPVTPGERSLSAYIGVIAALISIWGLTQETYEAFRFYRETFGRNWEQWAQAGVSLVWTLSAAVLLVLGMSRRVQYLRILALVVFGVTVLKVFFFDLSFLHGADRIISFGALGVVLIGISWLYSRYGESLRLWALGKHE
ncbi:MAG: DUF2339 domain-containing protein [bacterium]